MPQWCPISPSLSPNLPPHLQPGLTSPTFPFLSTITYMLPSQTICVPLASRCDTYSLWTINDSWSLFLHLMRHLIPRLCAVLRHMSSLLISVHVYFLCTCHLLNKSLLSHWKERWWWCLHLAWANGKPFVSDSWFKQKIRHQRHFTFSVLIF